MIRPNLAKLRGPTAVTLVAAILAVGFLVAFGARSAIVISTAAVDDALFIRLGQNLASGRWLGGYGEFTLVKGPGFPAFLALANLSGLPFPLAVASFYAACAAFAGLVVARVTGGRLAGLLLFAALLLAPPLYEGEMMRVYRDVFYAALTLAFASALIALASDVWDRRKLVVAAGLLGACAWLTREEGVWLAPLVLVALIPLLKPGHPRGLRAIAVTVRPLAIAGAVAMGLVVGFGLLNWAVYGRFVVNEIKDGAFQGAMTALQDASAPFHKTGVPVAAAARARIYAVSPAFASLKEPILDGVAQADATQWGCLENKAVCGDFGGGWFQWSLRHAAALKGHHASAPAAAAFYRQLGDEVRAACGDGRLTCKHWPVPLAPPMTAAETGDVARSWIGVADVMTFGAPVRMEPRVSDLSGPAADRMLRFLNVAHVEGPRRIRVVGWFRSEGDAWFSLAPGPGSRVLEFERRPSPDLVASFGDPRFGQQRFTIEVECPATGPCPVVVTPDGKGPTPLDLAKVTRAENALGGAVMYLDDPGADKAPPLLKDRLSRAWAAVAARLGPVYRVLLAVGAIAYAMLAVAAIRRRRIDPPLVICTALLGAVTARSLILALLDALSFRASSHAYALPGMLLLLLASAYAVGALIAARRPGVRDA